MICVYIVDEFPTLESAELDAVYVVKRLHGRLEAWRCVLAWESTGAHIDDYIFDRRAFAIDRFGTNEPPDMESSSAMDANGMLYRTKRKWTDSSRPEYVGYTRDGEEIISTEVFNEKW